METRKGSGKRERERVLKARKVRIKREDNEQKGE